MSAALDEFAARRVSGHGAPYDKVIATRYRQIKLRAIAQFLAQIDAVPVAHLLERCVRQGSSATRRFVHGLGRSDVTNAGQPKARTLVRSHEELTPRLSRNRRFRCSRRRDRARLGRGIDAFHASRGKRSPSASVHHNSMCTELPGRLTDEERWAIAEALEETGLFTLAASE